MAGNNTPAVYNPFRRAVTRSVTGSGGDIGGGGSGGGRPLENPLVGPLGDPSLNQHYGDGILGGVMQGLQAQRQSKAFAEQNQQTQAGMEQFKQEVARRGGGPAGFAAALTANPDFFKHLHNSGLSDADIKEMITPPKDEQVAPGAAMLHPGQQTPFYTNPNKPFSQQEHPAGVDRATGDLMTANPNKPGLTRNPGVIPIPSDTAAIRVANQPTKWNWDSAHQRYTKPPDPITGVVETRDAPAPVVNLNPSDKRYFANVENLHNAISDMSALSKDVSGIAEGRIKTFFGGKILGTNDPAMMYNDAHTRAENAIMSMNQGTSGSVTAMKERFANLPKDWQSYSQNKVVSEGWLHDLRNEAGLKASAAEANGTLPGPIANSLAGVGVLTAKHTPILNKLREDPDSMSADDLRSLGHYMRYATPEDQKAWTGQVQKVTGAHAGQSTQVTPGAPDAGSTQ